MTDTKKAPIGTVILKDVRLAFPDLFTAKDYQDNKRFRRSATFLVEPGSENDKAILAAIKAVAADKYKDKAKQIEAWRQNPQKFCYTAGDLKDYDGFAGKMALSGHRYVEQGAVGVFDKKGTNGVPNTLTEDDGKPYGGCYVNAKVELWAQDGKNSGIRCTLVSVQFWRDGDAFSSGSRPSADDFGVAEGADEESDLG